MRLQKPFNLPLTPDGFREVYGANDDEIIGILQGLVDVIIKIAGDRQFFLIPEQLVDLTVFFPDASGHFEPLQRAVDLSSHPDIIGMMSVGNESIIMSFHLATSCLSAVNIP
jgi:hypothetical protein